MITDFLSAAPAAIASLASRLGAGPYFGGHPDYTLITS